MDVVECRCCGVTVLPAPDTRCPCCGRSATGVDIPPLPSPRPSIANPDGPSILISTQPVRRVWRAVMCRPAVPGILLTVNGLWMLTATFVAVDAVAAELDRWVLHRRDPLPLLWQVGVTGSIGIVIAVVGLVWRRLLDRRLGGFLSTMFVAAMLPLPAAIAAAVIIFVNAVMSL